MCSCSKLRDGVLLIRPSSLDHHWQTDTYFDWQLLSRARRQIVRRGGKERAATVDVSHNTRCLEVLKCEASNFSTKTWSSVRSVTWDFSPGRKSWAGIRTNLRSFLKNEPCSRKGICRPQAGSMTHALVLGLVVWLFQAAHSSPHQAVTDRVTAWVTNWDGKKKKKKTASEP